MNGTTDAAPITEPNASGKALTPRRVDVYGTPHRALRYALSNVLLAMGRATFGDEADASAILAELENALWAADAHIAHEDQYLRPALLERGANAVHTLDDEHAEHATQVAELRAMARSLASAATSGARAALGETLYLHFSVFVAETFAHMAYEERVVQPLLDRLFEPEELERIHEAIVASIPPNEMFLWLGWMLPSTDRKQRGQLMAQVRAVVPPEVLGALLEVVRPRLAPADFAELAA